MGRKHGGSSLQHLYLLREMAAGPRAKRNGRVAEPVIGVGPAIELKSKPFGLPAPVGRSRGVFLGVCLDPSRMDSRVFRQKVPCELVSLAPLPSTPRRGIDRPGSSRGPVRLFPRSRLPRQSHSLVPGDEDPASRACARHARTNHLAVHEGGAALIGRDGDRALAWAVPCRAGTGNWEQVSSHFANRGASQCARQWALGSRAQPEYYRGHHGVAGAGGAGSAAAIPGRGWASSLPSSGERGHVSQPDVLRERDAVGRTDRGGHIVPARTVSCACVFSSPSLPLWIWRDRVAKWGALGGEHYIIL